jgi:hypothetical protein
MSEAEDNEKQFPPGVYDLTSSGGSPIFRVLSLSSAVPTTQPPFAWQAKREHWFSPLGANLQTLLGAGGITVKYTSDLGSLQAVANALANPTLYTFQLYARGVLTTSDWIWGVPPWATPAYFYQSSTTPKMQPLFEVASNDPTQLAHVNWFSPDNTLTSYFAGAQPGAQIACAAKSVSLIPTSGYYYRAS